MNQIYTLWKKVGGKYRQKATGSLKECYFELGKLVSPQDRDLTLSYLLKYYNYLIYPFGVNPESVEDLQIALDNDDSNMVL